MDIIIHLLDWMNGIYLMIVILIKLIIVKLKKKVLVVKIIIIIGQIKVHIY